MTLIDPSQRSTVESCGIQVWSLAGLIALQLGAVLRKHATEFIGLQEVSDLLDRLRKAYPALVDDVVPKIVTRHQLVDVLRRLIDENVSVRDLKSIVEALGEHAVHQNDGVALTELVRCSLSRQIAHAYSGMTGELSALLLDPVIEDVVRDGIRTTAGGTYLGLDPEVSRQIVGSVAHALQPILRSGVRPVILTTAGVRRYVRKLIEPVMPGVAVLSFEELPGELTIQPLGRAVLRDAFSLAA